jgi:hypothetical protein
VASFIVSPRPADTRPSARAADFGIADQRAQLVRFGKRGGELLEIGFDLPVTFPASLASSNRAEA